MGEIGRWCVRGLLEVTDGVGWWVILLRPSRVPLQPPSPLPPESAAPPPRPRKCAFSESVAAQPPAREPSGAPGGRPQHSRPSPAAHAHRAPGPRPSPALLCASGPGGGGAGAGARAGLERPGRAAGRPPGCGAGGGTSRSACSGCRTKVGRGGCPGRGAPAQRGQGGRTSAELARSAHAGGAR